MKTMHLATSLAGALLLMAAGVVHAAAPASEPANRADRNGWPQPTGDNAPNTFVLLDLFELQAGKGPANVRWDWYGWYGGDVDRLWIKTEGTQSTSSRGSGDPEAQILYGRLISPFFDAQAGVRVRYRSGPSGPGNKRVRTYASFGVQGIAPYRYELEPTVFVSDQGQISARVTATYDQLLTQRLILQPRFEFNVAATRDLALGVGSGLNDTELGARLRYEIRREFAPYVGVTWKQSYGETGRLVRAEGEPSSLVLVVVGVRLWF